jgi:hypothetical protein
MSNDEERPGALLPKLRTFLGEEYEGLLLADGFDDCMLGVSYTWTGNGTREFVAIYSVADILKVLMKDGMSYEEDEEYFDFNIESAYVGRRTPIYVRELPTDLSEL